MPPLMITGVIPRAISPMKQAFWKTLSRLPGVANLLEIRETTTPSTRMATAIHASCDAKILVSIERGAAVNKSTCMPGGGGGGVI